MKQSNIKKIEITSEYITLGQLLKYAGIIENGSMAKNFLVENDVHVNDELENRRGRKLYNNFTIVINGEVYCIFSN